jgi:hypothetical protein
MDIGSKRLCQERFKLHMGQFSSLSIPENGLWQAEAAQTYSNLHDYFLLSKAENQNSKVKNQWCCRFF